jgi:lactoylglutathione lyase
MTDVTELRVALTVADFDEAVAFYRDALGLEQLAAEKVDATECS